MIGLEDCSLAPETITLCCGPVQVQRFSSQFPLWRGDPLRDICGGKAVFDCAGIPVFAELALISILTGRDLMVQFWLIVTADASDMRCRQQSAGFQLRSTKHMRRSRRSMTDEAGAETGWPGAAMVQMFIECKRKSKDRMNGNQRKWLESALGCGILWNNLRSVNGHLDEKAWSSTTRRCSH